MAGYGFNTGLDGHRIRPLSENEAEEIAEGLKIVYGSAREQMLRNVSSRLGRGVSQYGWAERKANEVLQAHEEMRRTVDRAASRREKLLSDVMDRAYLTGNQKFRNDMLSILGQTAHTSPNSMKAGYILADLNNSLNSAERRILRQFDDKYADIIGAVSSKMSTGVTTTRQAVGEALTEFADEGIDCFIDRGGHRWTLENYSEMAVLTAIERSTIAGYVDTMEEYGYDLAIIDGHAGACPICEAWEGVIVSVSGNNPDYPSLDEAESAGCFHPRCMHGITTYYPDISRAPAGGFRDEPREIEGEAPEYTARSKQRYMERMIRKYKDRAIVAQTPQQKLMARNKVKQWEDALDDLIESQPADNYLYRHRSREIPQGQSAKTAESSFSYEPSDKNTINETYINSPEYRDRFTGITGNQDVDSAIADEAQRMLFHRTGTNYEDLVLLDSKTGELLYRLDSSERNLGVRYDQGIVEALTKAHDEGREIISIHNHPNNTPPSLDDGVSALVHGYSKGVVVCADGHIYTHTKANVEFTDDEIGAIHDKISSAIHGEMSMRPWFTILSECGIVIDER